MSEHDEYIKLFINNCKMEHMINCHRPFVSWGATMSPFFYMLTYQTKLNHNVFFTSVELLTNYLTILMITAYNSIDKRSNDWEHDKGNEDKYLKNKYLIGLGCFSLSTKICNQSIDEPRLVEYFNELLPIDPNIKKNANITPVRLIRMESYISNTINYKFSKYIPHISIEYFIKFLNSEVETIHHNLYHFSIILLIHIYLQWDSLIEILMKQQYELSTINQIQKANIVHILSDPLLIGSSTILAASKIFFLQINSELHEKIFSSFLNLLGMNPMRTYMVQLFAEQVVPIIEKSFYRQLFTDLLTATDDSTSQVLIYRKFNLDDEGLIIFSS